MRVSVKIFGLQAEKIGGGQVDLDLPAKATCADLRQALRLHAPALSESLPSSRFAINHEYAGEGDLIHAGDEVALIGLVNGG